MPQSVKGRAGCLETASFSFFVNQAIPGVRIDVSVIKTMRENYV
jgi:hypothetical protein